MSIGTDLKVVVGDVGGEDVLINIRGRNLLVTGTIGCGKTSLTRVMLMDLLVKNKDKIDVHILDIKGVDYIHFKDIDNVNVEGRIQSVCNAIGELTDELALRREKLNKSYCFTVDSYNKLKGYSMKDIIVIVEDLNLLLSYLGTKDLKENLILLNNLLQIGRSYGISFIVTAIDGSLTKDFKCDFQHTLTIGDSMDTKQIVNPYNQAYLQEVALYSEYGRLEFLKTVYMDEDIVAECVNNLKKRYVDVDLLS